jgi:hypothetical protein
MPAGGDARPILNAVSQTNLNHLVELYEYKVMDVLARREPRGGKTSVRELREQLTNAGLNGMLLRRFRESDRKLREQTVVGNGQMQVIEEKGLEVAIGLETAPGAITNAQLPEVLAAPAVLDLSAPADEETATLRELSLRVWETDFIDELRDQGRKYKSESSRSTLRLIYALLHNLDQYAENPNFASDINLSKFKVISAVPPANDSLISFSSMDVIDELMRSFAAHCVRFQAMFPKFTLPSTETLPYLRRFALAIANDSRAGEPLPQPSPTPREITNAIESARNENTSSEVKRQTLERLKVQLDAALAQEREISLNAHQERKNLLGALETLFGYLSERLPARLGGRGADAAPIQKALYAQNTAQRLEDIGAQDKIVAVRLTRPGGVNLGGVELHWSQRPEGWVLELNGAEYPLRKAEVTIPTERLQLRAISVKGAGATYVLLEVRDREGGGLWSLIALARCTAVLLEPSLKYLNLRLLRAAASWVRDRRIEASEHGIENAQVYATAPEDNLGRFARTASEKLLERFKRFPDATVERAFTTAAETLGEEGALERAMLLTRVFAAALQPTPGEVTEGLEVKRAGEVIVLAYRGEPVTVRVMGRAFMIRTDNMGRVFAFSPGGGGRALEDVLSLSVPGGFVLLAREGLRVAASFVQVV